MIKLSKIENNILDVFLGTNEEWALSQGFIEMDVMQDYNGQWILTQESLTPEYQLEKLLKEIKQEAETLKEYESQKYNEALNKKIQHNQKYLKPMFIEKWQLAYIAGKDDIEEGIENPVVDYGWYLAEDESSYTLNENIAYSEFLIDFRYLKQIVRITEKKHQSYLDVMSRLLDQGALSQNPQQLLADIEALKTSIDFDIVL